MDGEEGSPDGMDDEDPIEIQAPPTGIHKKIPTPEQRDNYVGVSIMLPRGETMLVARSLRENETLRVILLEGRIQIR